MALTPVVRRTVTSWSREPARQPSSIELTQGNQGNLRLKPRPVPQEPVQENLTGVTDIHLFEPLIQGRDEHRSPEQVDRADGSGGAAAASRRTTRPGGRREWPPGRPGHKPMRILSPALKNLAARKLPARWNGAGPAPSETARSRPSGPRKTSSRSRRSIASIPTRRQKSARFVQHAMLTCWQLSTSSPVDGVIERARASAQPGAGSRGS